MIRKEVRVYAPATVSNVGPGFDLLGFALEAPGDELLVRRNNRGTLHLVDESGCNLPLDPAINVAALAADSLLEELGVDKGFDLVFTRKIHPGSGVGSSAASCVAAVVGVNEILGSPFEIKALVPYALEGEKVASGATHADNVAPALLGGITLIRGYDPLDIKHIPYPDDLWCAVVHPSLEIRTLESRKLIPREIPMSTALQQCGNLAGLVAGLITADYGLISRSVRDVFAEPHRKCCLPEFEELRKASLHAGSLGTGLSGSGPSVFSLCRGEEMALTVGRAMKNHFDVREIEAGIYVSRISRAGCRII
ncbi:MAG: homoserine kinase [Bacteroidetes bacterium]|nr:MAG: homoserine kinase [Bacteroidota bacterium]